MVMSAVAMTAGAGLLGLSFCASALDLTAGSGAAQGCPASGDGVTATAGAVAWLQPAPVVSYDDYGDDHYKPALSGNRGVGVGFGELTAVTHGLCIGAVYRHEYHGLASRDLLDALVGNKNGQQFDPGRSYALFLDFNAFQATGLRLRKVLDFNLREDWSLHAGIGASLLKGLKGQYQSLQGDITASSGSWARGSATWLRMQSDVDYEDFNPYVPRGKPQAFGYSTDVQLTARSREGWEIDFIAMDIYGRLRWHDLPRSVKHLDNAEISYNANLDRNAAIEGQDSIVSFSQHIEPKYHLALTTRPLNGWSAVLSDDAVGGLHFPAMGARHCFGASSVDLAYDLRTHGVALAWVASSFRVSVATDDVRIGRANVLGTALQTFFAW